MPVVLVPVPVCHENDSQLIAIEISPALGILGLQGVVGSLNLPFDFFSATT